MISKALAIAGRGGAGFLSIALIALLVGVEALAQSPDAGDASLRLRRAAQAMAAAEEKITELNQQLKTEKSRVVTTEVERQLNRDAISHLERELAAAQIVLAERKQTFEATQKEVEAMRAKAPTPPPPPPPPPPVASPPPPPPVAPAPDPRELARAVQAELSRVGCDPGGVDGVWGPGSQRALQEYNRHARSSYDGPTVAALEQLRQSASRTCPLSCKPGFKVDGDRCVAVVCGAGQVANAAGECVEDASRFDLTVCNRYRNSATVAISAPRNVGMPETVSGWYRVDAGECKHIGQWRRGRMYWMAVDYSNTKTGWRGEATKICVPEKAFNRVRTDGYTCQTNETLEGFFEANVTALKFTINLNP
jgi:uncharacterized membrane protein